MSKEPLIVHSFIDGEAVSTEEKMPRENPSNPEEIVGYAPVNTREETQMAIEAAKRAFPSWAATPVEERIERMNEAVKILKDLSPELVKILSREHGKPLYDAQGEMVVSTMWMEHASKIVKDVIKDKVVEHENGRAILTYEPMGVVSAIFPWNYPISLSTIKIAPALLTGNTLVLKPSPYAPLAVSIAIEEMAKAFPPGVINMVHGAAEVGEELVTNPTVAKIVFTGGTKTAKHIMRGAADTIKDLTLDLGGNDPAIFLPEFDVNDERAMRRIVVSNFLTAGQICMIAKRVYVHRSIYDDFVEKYIEAANKWIRVGDPFNPAVTIGPVNNKAQLEYVQSLVEGAQSRGAKVTKLGKILNPDLFEKGYYLQPTLVTHVDPKDPIVVEEQFGPTVPIVPYDDVEEAIQYANDNIYGLTSSVWGDEEHALKVARRIEAGTTMINTASVQGLDVRFPFGGVKQSGIGREYGEEGILTYVNTKVISVPETLDLAYIPE